ncbi:histidine phosphatase family protein [Rhodospirillaceae bacterium SYSU D60014]|uniref:SixA phosphatase family protein n=1 Tax=Virgifigura deserti TaxID=2268457 RepID=UPI000E675DA6
MRSLFILRHAKSSWDDPRLADFDRPLAPRGRRAAAAMGAYLRTEGVTPDLALCSTARRARETFAFVSAESEGDVPVRFLRELYAASPGDLLHQIGQIPDSVRRLLLIGHNPAVGQLAIALASGGDADALKGLRAKYPTGALTMLTFDAGGWADITAGGRLERFVRPADLA